LLSLVSVARILVNGQVALVTLAFLAGVLLSLWAVAYAPAIASFTPERSRAIAFSLFSSIEIGLGVVGGALAGQAPGWLERFGIAQPRRATLLGACALIALSAFPVLLVRIPRRQPEERTYPRNPFVYRFLAAFLLWNLATGSFNPLFNAYFAQHLHQPLERIGWIFSASQFMQVVAILAAPLVLRRLGLVRGIAAMQAATAAALFGLGIAAPRSGALLYIAYMAFQYMSEPGMFTVLMNSVKPGERSGASALNMFIMNGGQAAAAAAGGLAAAKFGYSLPLSVGALMALAAAATFGLLLDSRQSSTTEQIDSR
jgi:predicted MFS family arabinose efflux permease